MLTLVLHAAHSMLISPEAAVALCCDIVLSRLYCAPAGDTSCSVTLTGTGGCERLCVKASQTGLPVNISRLRARRGMKYSTANLKEAMMHSCFIACYR